VAQAAKQVKAGVEKPSSALLEKTKIAEEIKLNVTTVGMDLLKNSAQPIVVSRVNNLMAVTSPKGLGV